MANFGSSPSNIQTARVIGRVGALAVALGVGSVWFSGGIASADSSSDGETSTSASHPRSAAHTPARASSTPRAKRAAVADLAQSRRKLLPAAAAAPITAQAAESARPAEATAPITAQAADPAPAVEAATDPQPAPTTDEVSTLTTAGTDTVESAAA